MPYPEMYHQNPQYSGYQSVPPQSMRPPTHPPPPLSIPGHTQHQYPPYNVSSSPAAAIQLRQQQIMPPSPSGSSDRQGPEEEYFNLPGPKPTSHVWDDYIWTLEVRQHPQRARMCGFGDKDRRPISPPPCIRLIIYYANTKEEVNYETFSEIDLIHLVLTVDIWDLAAQREMNLVKQSNASPCISSAATGAYPATAAPAPPTHDQPRPFNVDNLPGYPHPPHGFSPATPSTGASYYPPNGQGYPPRPPYMNGQNGQASPYQNGSPAYPRPSYPYPDPRYGTPQPQTPQSQFGSQLPPINAMTSMEHTYVHSPPASTQLYTRNLIGSLCASAFRLKDEHDKWGIWFILQDLSVRTEGWFRLKCSFFNISQAVQKQMENVANGRPNSTNTNIMSTAPCLASTFSNPFRVYSAKKFPGVVESTPLSKAFAAQGIKIPIRKDTGGKRGRDDSDDDNSDQD